MSDNFKTDTLDSLCELIVDCPHSTPTWTTNGYVVIRNQNINDGVLNLSSPSYTDFSGYKDRTKRAAPQENDIVITREAPMGRVCLIPKEPICCLGQRQVLLRADKNKISAEYLYWSLRSPFVQHQILVNEGTGATVSNMRIPVLKALEIPRLESIEIENKKASDLSNLQNKIQLNTQINQTLEQIAQALFKSWFVDFDPVRAKIQALSDGLSFEQAELAAMQAISGKTPEELTALSQTQPDRYAELVEIAKAFPCEIVEVDGVEMPKGWEVKALSDLGQIICGKTPSKSNKEFYGNDVPFIKIPDMHNQVFITQTTDNLSVAGANSQSKKYIPPKSICVSCIATVGLVSMTSKRSHTNQQINSIIPNNEQTSEFLYLSLKQPSMTKHLKDLASGGSATLNLNTSTFSKIEIIKPSKEIIDIFYKKVCYFFEKILSNSIENKRLSKTRDLLLPRLLNGEI
ncbi:MAG: restriction endonuclease subunit S [Haemophilus parainfluenzae]|nr:restriction endonuclease subunit S [Haemophilus parainfluenzae]